MNYLPDIKLIYSRLKSSAKKRGICFDLEVTDLYELSYPITCPILNIPLKFNKGKAEDNSYSVDRKDSSLGYTSDNIWIISWKANRLKNDASTTDLQRIAEYYSEN